MEPRSFRKGTRKKWRPTVKNSHCPLLPWTWFCPYLSRYWLRVEAICRDRSPPYWTYPPTTHLSPRQFQPIFPTFTRRSTTSITTTTTTTLMENRRILAITSAPPMYLVDDRPTRPKFDAPWIELRLLCAKLAERPSDARATNSVTVRRLWFNMGSMFLLISFAYCRSQLISSF